MDLFKTLVEEIALEGLEGVQLPEVWTLLASRQPSVDCAIDDDVQRFLWRRLLQCPQVLLLNVDYNSPSRDIPNLKRERIQHPPVNWVYTQEHTGYARSFQYRDDVTQQLRSEQINLQDAMEKYGSALHLVVIQGVRERILYGETSPPVNDEIVPERYVILELIGKTRWNGFLQVNLKKLYGMDPRSSFHHIKILMKQDLVTKKAYWDKSSGGFTVPNGTRIIHLPRFVTTQETLSQLKTCARMISKTLEEAPDQMVERSQLRLMSPSVGSYKRAQQLMIREGNIELVVGGEVLSVIPANLHNRKDVYVHLIQPYIPTEFVEDTHADEWGDYIRNCYDIEPQFVYEEPLHHQAFKIISSCREKGISMKKLAEILCVPHQMARCFIRYFDTNKIGRIVHEEDKKVKLQKIVDIRYLHECAAVKSIVNSKRSLNMTNKNPTATTATKETMTADQSLAERNLSLADDADLVRCSVKKLVSKRHLERKLTVVDLVTNANIYECFNDLYKEFLDMDRAANAGICCRKTLRKLLDELSQENRIKIFEIKDDDGKLITNAYGIGSMVEESVECQIVFKDVRRRHDEALRRKSIKHPSVKKERKGEKSEKAEETAEVEEEVEEEEFSDTDEEKSNLKNEIRASVYGRFRRIQVMHYYLWCFLYKSTMPPPAEVFEDTSEDILHICHRWFAFVEQAPLRMQGVGWFRVVDVIDNMPLCVFSSILGLRRQSKTAEKFAKDAVKRYTLMKNLPPKLYNKLVAKSKMGSLEACVDILVWMSQMGLVAVHPTIYPKKRKQVLLFLRREAMVVDTRFSQKNYDTVLLPPGIKEFPRTIHRLNKFADVEKYWTDLNFICLNTPLGCTKVMKKQINNVMLTEDGAEAVLGPARKRRTLTYTILRDFQGYYQTKDFNGLTPVLFGNGLGAGGLDSRFFGHLSKNWSRITAAQKKATYQPKKPAAASSVKAEDEKNKAVSEESTSSKRITVSKLAIKHRKGGKGLKRNTLRPFVHDPVLKKQLIEKGQQYEIMMAKRYEKIKEIVKARMVTKIAKKRLSKKVYNKKNHDEVDRAALKRMKGKRVGFSEREDAYVLMSEIIKDLMKLYDRDRPLHREHIKVLWCVFRDVIHRAAPEARDKTWNAIQRRGRYIRKFYKHSLIVHKTCVRELSQNNEFMESIKCTADNWKEKVEVAFKYVSAAYTQHFNPQARHTQFPEHVQDFQKNFEVDFPHMNAVEIRRSAITKAKSVRKLVLCDLIHNSLATVKSSPGYTPVMGYMVFETFPMDELEEAFRWFRKNQLVTRLRLPEVARNRHLHNMTLTYNFTNVYYRFFNYDIPMKTFQAARAFHISAREGKPHNRNTRDHDIHKLPQVKNKGSIEIAYNSLCGGHLAYIISSFLNNKLIADFTLLDDLVRSDTSHLKTINKSGNRFQKVAYEQRVKRVVLTHDARDEPSAKRCKPEQEAAAMPENDGDLVQLKPPGIGNGIQQKNVSDSSMSRVSVGERAGTSGIGDIDLQISTGKLWSSDKSTTAPLVKVEPTSVSTVKKKESGARAPLGKDDLNQRFESRLGVSESISDKIATLRKSGLSQTASVEKFDQTKSIQATTSTTSSAKRVNIPDQTTGFKKACKSVTFNLPPPTDLSYGRLTYGLSFPTLSCRYSTIDQKAPAYGDYQKHFVYTNQPAAEFRRPKQPAVPLLRETKISASRTSLIIHRNLTDERLVPTNAMNTHDSLIIDPIRLSLYQKPSPYRFFDKKKPRQLNEKEKELWSRLKQCQDSRIRPGMSLEDYIELFTRGLKPTHSQVEFHKEVIKLVQKAGVCGVSMPKLEHLLAEFSNEVRKIEDHVQTLINFNMMYRTGCDEEVLVSSAHVHSWCFRSTSKMCSSLAYEKENPGASKDGKTKEGSKKLTNENQPNIDMTIEKTKDIVSNSQSELSTSSVNKSEVTQKSGIGELKSVISIEQSDALQDSQSASKKTGQSEATVKEPLSQQKTEVKKDQENKFDEEQKGSLVKAQPWLKLDGSLNGMLLKRFQECILIHVISHPGSLQKDIVKHFYALMRPHSCRIILNFLVLNGCITRHYQRKRTCTLFRTTTGEEEIYYLPTTISFLNMMDINR